MSSRLFGKLATVAVLSTGMTAVAADYTWSGSLGGSWADGANFTPAAPTGGPGAGDTVTVNKACALSEQDEAVLDKLDRLIFTGGGSTYLYAAAGQSVTLRCPVESADGASLLGKVGEGTLIIDDAFYATGTYFENCGEVILGPNAKSGITSYSRLFRMNSDAGCSVTFTGPITVLDSCRLPVFQTRNKTLFKFAADNVFAEKDVLFQIGTASGFTGGLDLQGHDQEIARMSFMPPKADNPSANNYTLNHVLKSDTAATLTITKGAVVYKSKDSAASPVSGAVNICANRIEGGLSLKLAADGTGTGVFMVSNYTGFASSTTGSVSCTAGTFTFLTGADFPALSTLEKQGTGNLVVQTGATINNGVELLLSGTGTLDVSDQLAVAHARLPDGDGGWKYLPAGTYMADDSAMEGHLAGSGQIIVLNGDPGAQVVYTTHVWSGAAKDGLLTTAGNWDVAPTLNSLTEILRFPADADYTTMPTVVGEVTVAGIEVAYSGRFTLCKSITDGGLLNVGVKSLRFTDATEEGGTRDTFYIEPDITFAAFADHTIKIDPNTKVSFYSAFTTPDSELFSLIFDGPAVVLRGDSVNCRFPMVFTNTTAITCYRAHSFGATCAEIRAPVLPLFRNTHVCATPWSAVGAFDSSTKTLVYDDKNSYPFEFQGAVSITGTEMAPHGSSSTVFDYTGYLAVAVKGDLTFSGGLHAEHLERIQFAYDGADSTLTFTNLPFTRGSSQVGGTGKVDVRFYGVSTAASKLVPGEDQWTGSGYYLSRLTVLCRENSFAGASLTPYVNSRVPGAGNLWGVFDLNGTTQALARLASVSEVTATRYAQYPEATYDVTSAMPGGVLRLCGNYSNNDTHVLRLTDQAGFETCAPWTGNLRITNAVSTTAGMLKVGSGTVTFLSDAGWAEGTNVTVGAAGKLAFAAGTRGFEPLTGTKSKVNLCLEPGSQLEIAEGVTLRVATCETNGGTRLAPGYYAATAATGVTALGDYITGGGRLHVRSRSGLVGTQILLR